jgi:hypothetical protein
MRRLALLVALGLAGCGAAETGESGGCAAAVVRDGVLYRGTGESARGLRSGQAIEEGFVSPACNDTGGNDPDRPTRVFAVRGVSPELAVIDDGSLYVNVGYFTELPDHPLHDRFHGGPDRPRRKPRGSRCAVDGRVLETFSVLWAETDRGRVTVGVDVRTRIEGFDRAGLPYLQEGDAIRIRGRCGDEFVLARRIEPRP